MRLFIIGQKRTGETVNRHAERHDRKCDTHEISARSSESVIQGVTQITEATDAMDIEPAYQQALRSSGGSIDES